MHVACPLWQPHVVQAARLSALKALKANGGTMPAYPGMRRRILSSGRLLDSTGSSTSSPAAGDRALRNHAHTDIYKCATSCWDILHCMMDVAAEAVPHTPSMCLQKAATTGPSLKSLHSAKSGILRRRA